MPQLMIDTSVENYETLRLCAAFLEQIASQRNDVADAPEVVASPVATPVVPAGTAAAANLPPLTVVPPLPPGPLPVFLPPPPPPLPLVPVTAPPAAAPTAVATVAVPLAPLSPAAIPTPPSITTMTSPSSVPEYDSARMPWDARIHQRAKGRKKDGTWKLIKGIDASTVAHVTAELHAGVINSVPVPAPAPLPPPPPVMLPEPPAIMQPVAAPAVGLATPTAPVFAAPPAPSVGITFRDLVAKIVAAKIPHDKVSAILQKRGAPNLQMLNAMAHLIPDVNADIDALAYS